MTSIELSPFLRGQNRAHARVLARFHMQNRAHTRVRHFLTFKNGQNAVVTSISASNWRQNGSRAIKIEVWKAPGSPKLVLGRSGRRFGGLGARLDGHLGQGTVWTPSWGHLGAPGGVSGSILEGFGGPKRVQKSNFLDPEWKSAK